MIVVINSKRRVAVTATLTLLVAGNIFTGCANYGHNKADTGLAVGAVAGGLLGSAVGGGNGRIAAAIAGAAIGGIVGSEIGRSLDRVDRKYAQRAALDALENGRSGEPTEWRNPDSGRHGTITPSYPYLRRKKNCRDYVHKIYIDGHQQALRGTACRNLDGTWSNIT